MMNRLRIRPIHRAVGSIVVLAGVCAMGMQTGHADILFSTYASTGAWDAGNIIPKGGSDGSTGQAFAIAPGALDVGTYNTQLFSASATASADLASGQLHVTATSDGPAAAYAY